MKWDDPEDNPQKHFFFHLRAHNQHVDYSGAYNTQTGPTVAFTQMFLALATCSCTLVPKAVAVKGMLRCKKNRPVLDFPLSLGILQILEAPGIKYICSFFLLLNTALSPAI